MVVWGDITLGHQNMSFVQKTTSRQHYCQVTDLQIYFSFTLFSKYPPLLIGQPMAWSAPLTPRCNQRTSYTHQNRLEWRVNRVVWPHLYSPTDHPAQTIRNGEWKILRNIRKEYRFSVCLSFQFMQSDFYNKFQKDIQQAFLWWRVHNQWINS